MKIELIPLNVAGKKIVQKHGSVCRVLTHDANKPIWVQHIKYPNKKTHVDSKRFNFIYIEW